ncbi:GGDEF domain-containing protein [Uliginosibacterium sp. 31-16]|uniref:GGDEF domain-containing protein n=1 Tax=Uliginosibacterium sp. 31-16 TaxID=3068315 RepID=UPI00273FC803|nr:GGDEF domain-containing protein [Uliginosibacterium sp. 31-16]MDP5241046.1 GGDEF domain-containing protein [Uliginosibacterium sp. 31-16]
MPLRQHLPALLVFTVSLGVTALLWRHEQQITERHLHTQFDYSLRDTTARIVQRLSAYEQMLRGVQGFHAGAEDIRRDEFAAYVNALQLGADFAGIQGVGRIHLVAREDKERLQAELRSQGLPDFTIRPGDERSIYAPITQVEPFTGRNLIALGFDPYTDPTRRAAMDAARDAGVPRITGKLHQILDQKPDDGPSFVMYAPLFRQGTATDSLAARRASIIGWIYAPVRLTELMASLYGEPDPDIAIHIHDSVDTRPETLLFASHPSAAFTDLQTHEYLEVGGHSWTIEAHALPGFMARFGRSDARIIAISGLCLSLLLTLLTHLLVSARQLALALAHRMTDDLRSSEERWKYALEGAGDGVWDRDLLTNAVFYSKRCLEIFGYTDSDISPLRSEWVERIHPDDQAAALAATAACMNGQQSSFASEYRLRCKDGSWKWILARGRVMSRDRHGKALRLIGTVSDIDERKAIEEHVRHMAQHDPLTNLPNRALFADRLQQALNLARRDQAHLALFFIDLDEFKGVNDQHSHSAGDLLLQEAARRMQACVRESDTVGRIGGDEFVVLLPALNNVDDARHVADKIRHALAEPFLLDGLPLHISASIGIACYPEHGDSNTRLWDAADTAMYAAKSAGGNRVQLATPDTASEIQPAG